MITPPIWVPAVLAALTALAGACTVRDLPPRIARSIVTSSPCSNEHAIAADSSTRRPGTLAGEVDGRQGRERVMVAVDREAGIGCRAFLLVETDLALFSFPVDREGTDLGLGLPSLNALAPIDALPGEDVVVDVLAGASTRFVAVFTLGRGRLEQVSVAGRRSAGDLFAYGGSVGHLEAADCEGGGLVALSRAVPRGDRYHVVRRFYRPRAATLVPDPALTERSRVAMEQIARVHPEFGAPPFVSC